MADLLSTLDELSCHQIDKAYGGDKVLNVVAKSIILEHDESTLDIIANKIKQIKLDEYDLIREIYDATLDASANIVPAKSGLEFWNNQPQIIVNGIHYDNVNDISLNYINNI